MDNAYQPITVDSSQRDEVAILDVLGRVWRKRLSNDLTLLNYYELLPVSYRSSVASIDKGLVELNVHKNQAVVMAAQKMTFLRSDHLPYAVIAMAQGIKIDRGVAFLSRFSYVTLPADRRSTVRVNMGGRLEATMQFGATAFCGQVYDLSIGGIAICTTDIIQVRTGSLGMITFKFNGKTNKVYGRLLRVSEEGWRSKYVIGLDLDPESERNIYQIILSREHEIIQELRERVERQS